MDQQMHSPQERLRLVTIGRIRRNGGDIHLEIEKPYRPALKQLDHFSHVMVFWWMFCDDRRQPPQPRSWPPQTMK